MKKQLQEQRKKMFVREQDLHQQKKELVTLVRTKYPDSREYSEKPDGTAIFSAIPTPGSSGVEVLKEEETEKGVPEEEGDDDEAGSSRRNGESRESGDEAYDPENATFSGGYAGFHDGDSDFSGGGGIARDLADFDIADDFEGDTTDDETDPDSDEGSESYLHNDIEDYEHQDFAHLDDYTEEDINYDKHDEYETGLFAWDRI